MIATIYIVPKTKIAAVFSQRSSLMTKLHEAKTIKFVHRWKKRWYMKKKRKEKKRKEKKKKVVGGQKAKNLKELGVVFFYKFFR
mgnify:CR=1 FL=1